MGNLTLEPVVTGARYIPPTRPPSRRLPWVLSAVLAVALTGSLIVRYPRPAEPSSPPAPAYTDPAITTESSTGLMRGTTVWRNQAGEIVAVMDSTFADPDATVWCRLTVGGQQVIDSEPAGQAAVCVWVRQA